MKILAKFNQHMIGEKFISSQSGGELLNVKVGEPAYRVVDNAPVRRKLSRIAPRPGRPVSLVINPTLAGKVSCTILEATSYFL